MAVALMCWSSGSGCLISDPPEYREPAQSVFLLAYTANPETTRVVDLEVGARLPLSAEVRSEDAGEDVWGFLYRNWASSKTPLGSFNSLPASTLAVQGRRMSLDLTFDRDSNISGCQTVTMVVTHTHNLNLQDSRDLASLTWWFNIKNPNVAEPKDKLSDCPITKDAAP